MSRCGLTIAEAGQWAGPTLVGCTAVAALLRGGMLTVANVGDSRCVLSRAGRATAMTADHQPDLPDERDRILNVLRPFVLLGM